MPASHARTRHLIDPDRALELVLEAAVVLPAARGVLSRALGCVLAERILADRDQPPFDRAMMDGFAVRVSDAGRVRRIAREVPAGGTLVDLPTDEVVAVMTGAPCPRGSEAVVPAERVEHVPGGVRLPSVVRPQEHIAARGSECLAGRVVLGAGEPLTPLRLAVLAAFGITRPLVRPRPSLAIVSTGDELVPPSLAPAATQVRDSNGVMLSALARAAGVTELRHEHADDARVALLEVLARCEAVDVLVLCGGVSAGRRDLVPEALAEWGAVTRFHGVRQKPGKPMLFATRGTQLVFALPGNPMASHLGFQRYVRAAIRSMMGLDPRPSGGTGVLAEAWQVRGDRTVFQPCHARPEGGGWRVAPLRTRGSADIFAAAAADALVRLEPAEAPYPAGTEVAFEWLLTTEAAT